MSKFPLKLDYLRNTLFKSLINSIIYQHVTRCSMCVRSYAYYWMTIGKGWVWRFLFTSQLVCVFWSKLNMLLWSFLFIWDYICYIGLTIQANMYYKMLIGWTSQKIKDSYTVHNPFDFKHGMFLKTSLSQPYAKWIRRSFD
jgi:hypothetical protein